MTPQELPSLAVRQKLFTKLLGELIVWIYAQGWELSLGEGFLGDSINKPGEDTPHLREGGHFYRTAIDLNLFVEGKWKQSKCREWDLIGAKWLEMHPLCRWGGSFGDFNHLAILLRIDPQGREHF